MPEMSDLCYLGKIYRIVTPCFDRLEKIDQDIDKNVQFRSKCRVGTSCFDQQIAYKL